MNRSKLFFVSLFALTASATTGCMDDGSVIASQVGALCAIDTDCDPGLECEVEHGAGSCQLHGERRGDGASTAGSSASSAGSDGGVESDADTDASTGATGAANGSGDGYYCTAESVLECQSDADCGAGFECETEHCSSYCKPDSSDDGDDSDDSGDDHGSDDRDGGDNSGAADENGEGGGQGRR